MIRPVRPDKLARVVRELARWGASPAAGIIGASITHPDDVGLIDERGELTFAELQPALERARPGAVRARGRAPATGSRSCARNHRGFVDATLAVSKLGANGLYMNTAFSGPQLLDVVEREGPAALIYDEEFSDLLGEAKEEAQRFVSWSEDDSGADETTDRLIESTDDAALEPAGGVEPLRHPDLGDDRNAEGRPARRARHARPARGDVLEDPAARRRAHRDRGAALSLLGLRPLRARALR